MLRIVNLLIALSLGVHREQLEQRTGLTWPRPFLLRPFDALFLTILAVCYVMFVGIEGVGIRCRRWALWLLRGFFDACPIEVCSALLQSWEGGDGAEKRGVDSAGWKERRGGFGNPRQPMFTLQTLKVHSTSATGSRAIRWQFTYKFLISPCCFV